MKKFLKKVYISLFFFLFQTILEVVLIISLLYLGIPYYGNQVGHEKFLEVLIGVLGYYALIKLIYFGIIYFLLFIILSFLIKKEKAFSFSILNFSLSAIYPLIFILNGRPIKIILNQGISAIISAIIILLLAKNLEKKNK